MGKPSQNYNLYFKSLYFSEFDNGILDERWIISYAEYEFHWDGYMRDGLLIIDRQGSTRDIQLDLIGLLDFNINYKMQLFVKLLTEFTSGSPAD